MYTWNNPALSTTFSAMFFFNLQVSNLLPHREAENRLNFNESRVNHIFMRTKGCVRREKGKAIDPLSSYAITTFSYYCLMNEQRASEKGKFLIKPCLRKIPFSFSWISTSYFRSIFIEVSISLFCKSTARSVTYTWLTLSPSL